MPLPSAIFPAAAWDGGRVIDNPVDDVTDLSSDADTDRIGGAAINRLKAEMKSVQTQLKNEFQIDFNLKEGNAIVFDADRDTYIQADADDQLGFYVGGAEVAYFTPSYVGIGVEFEVFQGIYPLIKADANKNVMLGSPAAHITTDTEGFVYLNTVNGTPTGVPATTHGDSKPIVYDKVNDVLYVYNAGWQPVGSGTVGGSGTANFVPAWTASDTLGNSAYGDDGTYGTFMEIGSSTFNDTSTLLKWRGGTIPASFTHASAGGTSILFRAQDAFASSGGNGADIVFMPGLKDGGGTDGKFIVRQPGGVAGTDELQLYDDGTNSFIRSGQTELLFMTAGSIRMRLNNFQLRPSSSNLYDLGGDTLEWRHLYLAGDIYFGTSQDLTLARDSAGIFRFSTTGVTDALTRLKLSLTGSAPASYTAAADFAGGDAVFRCQSGGAHSSTNPSGGGYHIVLGAKGAGGAGSMGQFRVYESAAGDYLSIGYSSTSHMLLSTSSGKSLIISPNSSTVFRTAALATGATDGDIYIPSSAGKPTGTPTTYTGTVPLRADTTNNVIWGYLNSQWAQIGGAATFLPNLAQRSGGCYYLTSNTIKTTSDTAYWFYIGYTLKPCTIKHVEFRVSVAGSGAQTAEIALASSPSAPNKANQTLTKLAADGTLDSLLGTGILRNTNPLNYACAAGVHLWAGIRTAMATTQPQFRGVGDSFGDGSCLTTTTAGALTGAGPWTGVVTSGIGAEVVLLHVAQD